MGPNSPGSAGFTVLQESDDSSSEYFSFLKFNLLNLVETGMLRKTKRDFFLLRSALE